MPEQQANDAAKVAVVCPKCQTRYVVAKPKAAAKVTCKKCKATFSVGGGPRSSADDPLIGKTVGGCKILQHIASGSMGIIYKAKHLSLDRIFAIKVLPPSLGSDQSFVERFVREAKAAARLEHQNAIQVVNVGQEQGHYFMVMQFVEGRDLEQVIQQKGRLSVAEATTVIRQAATGLAAAHELGIIHRDIKPKNLMVTKDGVVKIADFGLARDMTSAGGLTQSGQIFGTPHYMSPEQCDAKPAGIPSDIYSLGATGYHMLTGQTPFSSPRPLEVLEKHQFEPLVPPHEVQSDIPATLSKIISKMMAKDPAERYQSCDELLADLSGGTKGKAAPASAGGDSILPDFDTLKLEGDEGASTPPRPSKAPEPEEAPAPPAPSPAEAASLLDLDEESIGLSTEDEREMWERDQSKDLRAAMAAEEPSPAAAPTSAAPAPEEPKETPTRGEYEFSEDGPARSPGLGVDDDFADDEDAEGEVAGPPGAPASGAGMPYVPVTVTEAGPKGRSVKPLVVAGITIAALILLVSSIFRDGEEGATDEEESGSRAETTSEADEAEEAYEAALRFIQDNPDEYDEALDRLRQVARGYAETEWAPKATKKVQEVMSEREKRAHKEFVAARDKGAKPVQAQRFGEAIRLLTAVQRTYPQTEAVTEARDEITRIEGIARDAFETAKKRAKRCLQVADYSQAEAIYRDVTKTFGVPAIAKLAEAELAEIGQIRTLRESLARYGRLSNELVDLVAQHEFEQAVQACRRALAGAASPAAKQRTQARLGDLELLDGLWKKVVKAAGETTGSLGTVFTKNRVRIDNATVVEAGPKQITLKAGDKATVPLSWSTVDDAKLHELIVKWVPPQTGSDHLALAIYCAQKGMTEAALGEAEQAARDPELRERVAQCLKEGRGAMVYVPAGGCVIGTNDGPSSDRPQHTKGYLAPYYIDRFEVTNAQYWRFVRETNRAVPRSWAGGRFARGTGDHPVTDVTWGDAQAYATWTGKRLPAEQEWEKAARWDSERSEARIWPWRGQFRLSRCNGFRKGAVGGLCNVGRFPTGISCCGCLDMAGNAAEWTSSIIGAYPGFRGDSSLFAGAKRVTRGGSFRDPAENLASYRRVGVVETQTDPALGFRCVRSASE